MDTAISADVLIVGGGQGGAQAATLLRMEGFEGSILIVSDEADPPYDRPPLSKEYLAGEKDFAQLQLRTPAAWAEKAIQLRLGAGVVRVDATAHEARLADGAVVAYGQLIWAAGGRARRLACPGAELGGVHSIRNRPDVDRLQAELGDTRDVAVIGGGYIGLEAAAVLTGLGKQVTVLEAMDRVLSRVAGPPLSRFYEAEHRARGVDVRLAARVEELVERDGRVAGVRLEGGEVIPAQMAIVGIGIDPIVEPLQAAGAAVGHGIRVDEYCRTSLPDVFAIGDVAEHVSRFANGVSIRLESVQNANDQAGVAARAICGKPGPYTATPWFWSNQYDLKLQSVGLNLGYDACVVRGEPAQRSFSVVYLRGGEIIALDCVNAVRDFAHGRRLVGAGVRPDLDRLGDPAFPLKNLA
jgi:3-phenylpropionate/trans-cinnamate dioxygenase ferredoxin reductase subunit